MTDLPMTAGPRDSGTCGAGALALDITGVSFTGFTGAAGVAAALGAGSSSLRLFHIYDSLLQRKQDATIVLRPWSLRQRNCFRIVYGSRLPRGATLAIAPLTRSKLAPLRFLLCSWCVPHAVS